MERLLTHYEEWAMLCIYHQNNSANSKQIMKTMVQLTGWRFPPSTLHDTVQTLIALDYLDVTYGKCPPRGGRSIIFYALTPYGAKALLDTKNACARAIEVKPKPQAKVETSPPPAQESCKQCPLFDQLGETERVEVCRLVIQEKKSPLLYLKQHLNCTLEEAQSVRNHVLETYVRGKHTDYFGENNP